MRERVARCRCGRLTATCRGEPVRVSVCHCLGCQRRTGDPFAAQARFPAEAVTVAGEWRVWERTADSGRKAWFRWCAACGGTVAYANEGMEDTMAVPIGAFDPDEQPQPTISIFEEYRRPWVAIVGEGVEHFD